jgi:hypothetical protein
MVVDRKTATADFLRAYRAEIRANPDLARCLPPPRRPGRPPGSFKIDPYECIGLFVAVDCAGLPKAHVLRMFKITRRWLDYRLNIVRAVYEKDPPDFLGDLKRALRPLGLPERKRFAKLFMQRMEAHP